MFLLRIVCFFFFNDTATTEIYTLSLHERSSDLSKSDVESPDQIRIDLDPQPGTDFSDAVWVAPYVRELLAEFGDRKSTRLNSSHANISYAVFCLKKKNTHASTITPPNSRLPEMT